MGMSANLSTLNYDGMNRAVEINWTGVEILVALVMFEMSSMDLQRLSSYVDKKQLYEVAVASERS